MKRSFLTTLVYSTMALFFCLFAVTMYGAEMPEPLYEKYEKHSEYVTMSDGVKLAVDVFLPSGYVKTGKPPTAFPVVFNWTPYNRSMIDPETGVIITDRSKHPFFSFLLSQGYAVVAADMRGCGASFGWFMDFSEFIASDGREMVDWIAAQSWSSGNVGMFGGSYEGIGQFFTASQKPEALKCLIPYVEPLDLYNATINPGGIYSYAFLQFWQYGLSQFLRQNVLIPKLYYPTSPVVDEDGDGALYDEIPVDQDGNGTFVGDYPWPVSETTPPLYPDDVPRNQHHYFNATMEHMAHSEGAPGNYDLVAKMRGKRFIDDIIARNMSWYEINPSHYAKAVMESEIPVYIWGGWFDIWPRGTVEHFATMKDTATVKLAMEPRYHSGVSSPWAEYLGINMADYTNDVYVSMLKWYDHFLKGKENGILSEPPVKIFVMNGEGWRNEETWPLSRAKHHSLYLAGENRLVDSNPYDAVADASGEDNYQADFTHHSGAGDLDVSFIALSGNPPVSNTFHLNRHMAIGGMLPESLPIRNEQGKKVLSYTSTPLEEDTEVTGHPLVYLWVSSTADYGDLYFYLEDVDENGQIIHVTDYQIRLGFNNLVDNDRMINNGADGIDVEPELPWHGFRSGDYTDRVLAGGEIVEVVRDLHPTSWVFKKGHRIRLSIACADWPTFRLHPKLAPNNRPDDPENVTPTITIYRSDEMPSRIELPVVAQAE